MAIPFIGEHLPMSWIFLLRQSPERFTLLELETVVQRVALIGSLLENQSLAEELARANEQIDHDARQVGELQRALLPATLPKILGLDIAVSYETSSRAGGDLYDFFRLDGQSDDDGTPGRWCVFIGDAAGHGLAAAVVMAIVQSVLHAHPDAVDGPGHLLMYANEQLCRKEIGGFVTAFLGIYEPASRRLTYANAGHPPPLMRRSSDASIIALDAVATYPLGIDESQTFEESTMQLRHGDVVLLYTDGITEARQRDGAFFEQEGLTNIFRDGGGQPAELIERIRKAVCVFEQGQPAKDDQTLVAARVL